MYCLLTHCECVTQLIEDKLDFDEHKKQWVGKVSVITWEQAFEVKSFSPSSLHKNYDKL